MFKMLLPIIYLIPACVAFADVTGKVIGVLDGDTVKILTATNE